MLTIHYNVNPSLSAGRIELPTKFSNGGFTVCQYLEGICWKRGVDIFQGGCSFDIKSKLKSKIFNDQKSSYTKIFSLS